MILIQRIPVRFTLTFVSRALGLELENGYSPSFSHLKRPIAKTEFLVVRLLRAISALLKKSASESKTIFCSRLFTVRVSATAKGNFSLVSVSGLKWTCSVSKLKSCVLFQTWSEFVSRSVLISKPFVVSLTIKPAAVGILTIKLSR